MTCRRRCAWTEERLKATQGRPDLTPPRTAAYFYWSTREIGKARDAFAQAASYDPLESSLLLHLALVADELGDTTRCDENFERLWANHQGQAPRANQVCRVLRKWLTDGGKGEPDLAFVNAMLESVDPEHRGALEFFVGRFLADHGKPELARPYLMRVSVSPAADEWLKILAADTIRPAGPEQKPKEPPAPGPEQAAAGRHVAGRG